MSENKAQEQTMERVNEYLDKMEELVDAHAGDAVDLGLTAMRIEALSTLSQALFVLLISAGILAVIAKCFINKPKFAWDESIKEYRPAFVAPMSVAGIVSGAFLIAAIADFLNIWHWIGIFNPDLYAVYKFVL